MGTYKSLLRRLFFIWIIAWKQYLSLGTIACDVNNQNGRVDFVHVLREWTVDSDKSLIEEEKEIIGKLSFLGHDECKVVEYDAFTCAGEKKNPLGWKINESTMQAS